LTAPTVTVKRASGSQRRRDRMALERAQPAQHALAGYRFDNQH